jgi:AAA+ superfamily predicted ATPase
MMEISRIIQSGLDGEQSKVVAYAKQLATKLEQNDPPAAKRIRGLLEKTATSVKPSSLANPVPVDSESRFSLADIEEPQLCDAQVVLAEQIQKKVDEFIRFAQAFDILQDANIGLSPNLLIHGPPGVGKTALARYIAARLGLPLLVARSDALISSFLGNTAKNMRVLFEHAQHRPCVLFLDEIDSIAKMRDDQHELGELKRVVISLLQNIDSLGGETILLAATNHAHLLDLAVWRRFTYQIELKHPDYHQRKLLLSLFMGCHRLSSDDGLEALTRHSDGLTGAELRIACENAIRWALLEGNQTVDKKELLRLILEIKLKRLIDFEAGIKEDIRSVWECLNGQITMKEMAEIFNISESTISRTLKPLTSKPRKAKPRRVNNA